MRFDLTEAIGHLARTPATLRGLLAGMPEGWLRASEGPDTFTPHDVVGHLICGEETDWIPRLEMILEHGERKSFVAFDRFGFRTEYAARPIGELLDRFEALRRDNLARLGRLQSEPAALERRGRHPEFGAVTVEQLLATWVVHDWNHVFQIVRVLARQYEPAVGPWKAYLKLLRV